MEAGPILIFLALALFAFFALLIREQNDREARAKRLDGRTRAAVEELLAQERARGFAEGAMAKRSRQGVAEANELLALELEKAGDVEAARRVREVAVMLRGSYR